MNGELPSLPSGSGDAQSEGDAPSCRDHSGCRGSREGLVGEGRWRRVVRLQPGLGSG